MANKSNVEKDDIDKLLIGAKNTSPRSDQLSYSKQKMRMICRSLSFDSNHYQPEHTVKQICEYIGSKRKLDRILYSEISNYIFSLNIRQRGTFATNVDCLLQYVLSGGFETSSEGRKEDCRKIVLKIYDHFQLALHQIENTKSILRNSVEELKEEIRKENKGIEREYITILAIFSSIVLTFVGGVSFSSELLSAMHSVSIYRLLLSIEGLAFVLLNLSYMMLKLIFEINDKQLQGYSIMCLNAIIGASMALTILAKFLSLHFLPYYISRFLFWCN